VLLITHEPQQLAWWNFARTCISTTSMEPYCNSRSSVQSQGHILFLVLLRAWRGQYT